MSVIRWGLITAGAIVLGLFGVWAMAEVTGFWFTFVAVILAGMGFMTAAVVVITRRIVGAVVRRLDAIMQVPGHDRYESAASFEAEARRAAEASQGGADRDELTEAAERIARIFKAAHGLRSRDAALSLERVAESGRALLTEAAKGKSTYRRLRGALVHNLRHVEAIALNLLRFQEAGADQPDLTARASWTLAEVADDFDRLRRRSVSAETMETEARLQLLEQDLGLPAGAGRPGPASFRPATSTRQGQ